MTTRSLRIERIGVVSSDKMEKLHITPSKIYKFSINIAKDGNSRSASHILSQKGVDMSKIREIWPEIPFYTKEIDDQAEINAHYKGYLIKQKADILAFKRDENLIIPENINYADLSGLSNESGSLILNTNCVISSPLTSSNEI